MGLIVRIKERFRKQLGRFCTFWAEVPGSIRSHLNTEELSRITIAALAAGGGFYGLSEAIMQNLSAILPAPGDAALAAVFLTAILESYRRLGQGRLVATAECPSQATSRRAGTVERPPALDAQRPARVRDRVRLRETRSRVEERKEGAEDGGSAADFR